jgi:hypothetical protein
MYFIFCNIFLGAIVFFPPTLNPNCDFTLTFFVSAFLPALCENEVFVYPYSQHCMLNLD